MAKIVEAEYGVPHCKFTANDQGFTVTFKKPPIVFLTLVVPTLLFVIVIAALSAWVLVNWIAFTIVAAAGLGGLYWLMETIGTTTTITVTPELVTIDGKSMRRSDFGTFAIYEKKTTAWGKDNPVNMHQVGYRLGNCTFPCGGRWMDERHITEFTAALNRALHAAPVAGAPSPEELRVKRQVKF